MRNNAHYIREAEKQLPESATTNEILTLATQLRTKDREKDPLYSVSLRFNPAS